MNPKKNSLQALASGLRKTMDKLPSTLIARMDTDDGGPGSGNWGHKGRPGEVGGSGKGGGKHYRGGRGDIMFTSSKGDWLNGLTGTSQSRAEILLHQTPKFKNKMDVKAAEKFIMQGKTSKKPEKVRKDKEEYLSLKGEARMWDDLKRREQQLDENLTDEDRADYDWFQNQYGIEGADGNDYKKLLKDGTMSEDEYDYWLDLKSKAMGGPDGGLKKPSTVNPGDDSNEPKQEDPPVVEPPKEPDPPKPEPPKVPDKIGYDWMKKAPAWSHPDGILRSFLNTGYAAHQQFPATISLNDALRDEAEQELTTQLDQETGHGVNHWSSLVTMANGYLADKGKYLEGDLNWETQCKTKNFPYLTKEESEELSGYVDKLLEKNSTKINSSDKDYDYLQNNGYLYIGDNLLRFTQLKAKALGLPAPETADQQEQHRKNRNKLIYAAAAEQCERTRQNSAANRADMIARGERKRQQRENGINPRNPLCQTAYAFGGKHYENLAKAVDSCTNKAAQHIWDCYEEDLRVMQYKGVRGAWYSPHGKGINLSIASAARGNDFEVKYGVVFHEFGHNIDYLAAKRTGLGDGVDKPFSILYNGGEFNGTLRNEIKELTEKWKNDIQEEMNAKGRQSVIQELCPGKTEMSFYNEESMFKELVKQHAKRRVFNDPVHSNIADISDMLCASASFDLGWGHYGGYFGREENRTTEAFAEMYSATLNNPGSLGVIKKHLPKSYACFERMMEFITKP